MCNALTPVGSAPAGAAKWGQLDMGGSLWEWALDNIGPSPLSNEAPPVPCVDCAQLAPFSPNGKVLRDTHCAATPSFEYEAVASRLGDPSTVVELIGVRCPRDTPRVAR